MEQDLSKKQLKTAVSATLTKFKLAGELFGQERIGQWICSRKRAARLSSVIQCSNVHLETQAMNNVRKQMTLLW